MINMEKTANNIQKNNNLLCLTGTNCIKNGSKTRKRTYQNLLQMQKL